MSGSNDPDQDLIPGLMARDEAVFRRLIDRRVASVHRVAYRLLGDRHDAEDVAQETFLKFWRQAETWKSEQARILTWLCRVATNDCYDRLAKKKAVLPGDMPDTADERHTHGETRMIQSERWDALQRAIMQLPDRQRAAISLCYDEDLSQREAALILSVSEKAYESLLVRARRTLREIMIMEDNHV